MAEPEHPDDKENDRVIIRTPRLLLRPAKNDDAASIHAAFRDPEVMRYWSTPPHENLEQTRKWVASMVESPNNGVTDFFICRVTSQSQAGGLRNQTEPSSPAIGKIGVWNPENCEIGFLLERKYWRQGFISEAMAAVLAYLFQKRNFQYLVADIDPRNEASKRVLEKFGFQVTGYRKNTFEVAGEWVDSLDMKLTREGFDRWMASQK